MLLLRFFYAQAISSQFWCFVHIRSNTSCSMGRFDTKCPDELPHLWSRALLITSRVSNTPAVLLGFLLWILWLISVQYVCNGPRRGYTQRSVSMCVYCIFSGDVWGCTSQLYDISITDIMPTTDKDISCMIGAQHNTRTSFTCVLWHTAIFIDILAASACYSSDIHNISSTPPPPRIVN